MMHGTAVRNRFRPTPEIQLGKHDCHQNAGTAHIPQRLDVLADVQGFRRESVPQQRADDGEHRLGGQDDGCKSRVGCMLLPQNLERKKSIEQ